MYAVKDELIQKSKALDEALRKLERSQVDLRRMAVIVRDSNDAITVQDFDGAIKAWNRGAEAIYGYSEQEALGMNIMSIIPVEKVSEYHAFMQRLREGEDVRSFETQRIAKDGRVLDVWLTVTPLADDSGRPMEIATTERDITERKSLEAELQNRFEKAALFASYVSHDLKNPAVGIHGFARRLCETSWKNLDENGRKYCEQIVKASEQILKLVGDLNYCVSEGGSPLQVEKVDLKELFASLQEEFSEELKAREISWSEPAELPAVAMDRFAVFRALRNLVENALRHGGEEVSEIRFGYYRSSGFHVFSVADDGVGLDCEDCRYLFEPFRRDKNARHPGSGLGLAIVKDVARRHRGSAWAEAGPQAGAVFSFSIAENL